jgi:hypothetical protein
VLVLGVVVSSEEFFLLFKDLVLSGESKEVDVKDTVLLGDLNEAVLDTELILVLESLNHSFQLRHLALFFSQLVTHIINLLFEVIFLLLVTSLHINIVFIKLVLSKKVRSDSLVKSSNFFLL